MSQQKKIDMAKYFYRASAADFIRIPGGPIAYWVSEKVYSTFKEDKLGSIITTDGQNKTANNEKYVRLMWELSHCHIGRGLKWLVYSKGGDYRKWFGNLEHVVDWSNAARAHYRKDNSCRLISEAFWYKNGITWTDITSSGTGFRYLPTDTTFDMSGPTAFFEVESDIFLNLSLLNSVYTKTILPILNPTLHAQLRDVKSIPRLHKATSNPRCMEISRKAIAIAEKDWNSFETSWGFTSLPILKSEIRQPTLKIAYQKLRTHWHEMTLEMQQLEAENNNIFIGAYGLQDELTPEVPLEEITLTCNPHYRYGGNKTDEELETMLQCDTMEELVSYAIGCMMGRYSLDKPGLILASQGETLQDYFSQTPSPCFAPDDDGILPLTDQEWFADDATNRFREFVRTAWGEKTLYENLDFVAESLCLHAIKPKKGEDSLDTIRRYLSSQFYKDHLRTYKKRPIYWLFSSGKHKAFECLIYLHRYNEGSLARMRTEYVIPLTAKLNAHANKLEKDIDASSSTAEKKALEKQLATLHNQQAELATFDEKLRHYADQRIRLDLDDGVRVNYGKFGDLLAEVNAITGGSDE